MRVFEFANFSLDESERALLRDGQAIPLAPKVFDTLLVLVENHGHLVTKDALMKAVWQDTYVEENNLTQYIFQLRRILSETAGGQKFIETVPRRGYRFNAEAREVSDATAKSQNGSYSFSLNPNSEEASDSQSEIAVSSPVENINQTQAFKRKFPMREIGSRVVLLSAGLILFIFVTGSFFIRYREDEKIWSPENIKFKHLTGQGTFFDAAISPDGTSLAYIVRGKRGEVRLKNIQTDSEIVIAQSDFPGFASPRFSPDGNFIYYSYLLPGATASAFRVPVLGGEPRRIAENLWSDFSVSPDGKYIAFPRTLLGEKRKTEIVVANADGSGNERSLAARQEPDYYALYGPAPAWSLDSERLTVAMGNFAVKNFYLQEINLQSGELRQLELQDEWWSINQLEWATENELFIIGFKKAGENSQLWQINFPGGAAKRISNDSNEYVTLNLSKGASRIAATIETLNYHLWLFDRETNQVKQLTFGANRFEGNQGLSFAPDNRIVFAAKEKNEYNIFSMNADGGDARQLTKNAGRLNLRPDASPDGNTIAFVSDRENKLKRIWLMKADGSSPRRLTQIPNDSDTEEENPCFSPDGRFVYYTFYRAGRGLIYKVSIDDGEPVEVRHDGAAPIVSPDEHEMVVNFLDDDKKSAQPWQLRIQSLNSDDEKDKLFDFPAMFLHAQWLPGAPHTLITADTKDDGTNLWQTDYETGERRQITDFNAERIDNFDVSKDGRFFVVSRGSDLFEVVLIER